MSFKLREGGWLSNKSFGLNHPTRPDTQENFRPLIPKLNSQGVSLKHDFLM